MTTIDVPLDGIPGVTGIRWSTDSRTQATVSVDGWTYNDGDNDWEIWGIVLSWAWHEGTRLWMAEVYAFVGRFADIVASTPAATFSHTAAIEAALGNLDERETITIDAVGMAGFTTGPAKWAF
jgi:hypothetical protein